MDGGTWYPSHKTNKGGKREREKKEREEREREIYNMFSWF
jgi:hypothetical protein